MDWLMLGVTFALLALTLGLLKLCGILGDQS